MSDARTTILGKIRQALADVPTSENPGDVKVARDYLTEDVSSVEERIEKFVERVSEYRAKVTRIRSNQLGETIASVCMARAVKTLVVPEDFPADWLPPSITILRDRMLTNEQLNISDGVLTGCALGIAQTGTIVLDRGPLQGRRALTLLPDYHICVVFEKQIVGMVPEAIKALKDVSGNSSRPLTWISGPSATSDIELNRVEGVHGPRTLEVLVVSAD